MLEAVPQPSQSSGLLLLDTCAERASLALFRGSDLIAAEELAERTASAALLSTLRSMLAGVGQSVRDLVAIGVVSGPGSFTGVRVGLALAKGLCEALSIPLIVVSRLRVLLQVAGVKEGVALLSAGRDQMYVRSARPGEEDREWMAAADEVAMLLADEAVAVTASPELVARFSVQAQMRLVALSAQDALGTILEARSCGGEDLAATDANYVRNEQEIYANPRARAGAVSPRESAPNLPSVRLAREQDLSAVLAFLSACPDVPTWPSAEWRKFVGSPPFAEPGDGGLQRALLVAAHAEGKGLAGLLAFTLLEGATEVELLLVSPGWRRRGVGRALSEAWLAWAADHRATQALLEVRASNLPAQALYRQLGFIVQTRRRGYYRDPPEDALLMQRPLPI